MAEKSLPIRVFAKRAVDEMRTEGGGGSNPPSWILSGEELERKSRALVGDIKDCLNDSRHNSDMPYVLQADLIARARAKSHRKAIVDMLEVGALPTVVGVAGDTGLMLKVDRAEADKIIGRISETNRYGKAISALSKIKKFEPYVNIKENETIYKVRLLDHQDEQSNETLRSQFEALLREQNLVYRAVFYSAHLVLYRLNANQDQMQAIADSSLAEGLFSIEPMPRYHATLDSLDEDGSVVASKAPEPGSVHPTVGILDSGIESIDQLTPWLIEERWSPYPESILDTSHGTFVSGVALYGDDLEGRDWVGGIDPFLFDAAVLPSEKLQGVEEDELISNVRRAVALKHETVKVWNLSVSMPRPVSDNSFSDLAVALDDIQDEYGVMICKSAGNCAGFAYGAQKSRVRAGGDSVRALTVGSAAHEKGPWDLAEVGSASPFSCVGRGPEFIIKPEVCHYGGNAGLALGQIQRTPVKSLSVDGGIALNVGTSFSTPRLTALAASLEASLDQKFDPLLTKTLIVHSATHPRTTFIPSDDRVLEMGFGIPGNLRSILYDNPHEATLILRDALKKGEYIDIMDFPMPASLVKNGYYTGQIIVTVVYKPILDASQGGEYCQSDINVRMGTYAEKRERDIRKPSVLNAIGRKDAQNLLLKNPYSKKRIKDAQTDFGLAEQMLIEYEGKYCPVKKFAVDLSDLTDAYRASVESHRSWYLEIYGVYRDNAERRALREKLELSQEFCVVISIRDPLGREPVYNEVAQGLTNFNFLHRTVKLNNEVQISG